VIAHKSSLLDPYDVLRDSQVSIRIFHNNEMLYNIRNAVTGVTVSGVCEKLDVSMVDDLPGFGRSDCLLPSQLSDQRYCFHDLATNKQVVYNSTSNIVHSENRRQSCEVYFKRFRRYHVPFERVQITRAP
jgi:hypothetical protein